MADKTRISWTDATWPVVTGCTHVSEGCDHCYAAKLTSGRLKHLPAYQGLAVNGRFNGIVRLLPDRLQWPLHWRKPRRIFVSDMADLFHEGVPDEYIARVFAVMAITPEHTYQVLTKRHGRMRSLLSRGTLGTEGFADMVENAIAEFSHAGLYVWPLPNVHVGVSAENQKWADIRIPALLDTPAAVRFVSAEPLLEAVDFTDCAGMNAIYPDWVGSPSGGTGARHLLLDWVVVGGESGPDFRPMEIRWLEAIVKLCVNEGVPIWVKQDSGLKPGRQGRIPDELFVQQFPKTPALIPP